MSFHATVEGILQYSTEEAFRKSLTAVNQSSSWDLSVSIPSPDGGETEQQWAISIPHGYYRNFVRHLSTPLELADSGMVVGTSTDGVFVGWTAYANGDETEHDLDEWVNEHTPELAAEKPTKDEYASEDGWFGDYVNWQSRCQGVFRIHHADELEQYKEDIAAHQEPNSERTPA